VPLIFSRLALGRRQENSEIEEPRKHDRFLQKYLAACGAKSPPLFVPELGSEPRRMNFSERQKGFQSAVDIPDNRAGTLWSKQQSL